MNKPERRPAGKTQRLRHARAALMESGSRNVFANSIHKSLHTPLAGQADIKEAFPSQWRPENFYGSCRKRAIPSADVATPRLRRRPMPKRASNHNILRIAAAGRSLSDAWVVSFIRKGAICRKWFSDSMHGGKAKALAAARAWRDATMDKALQTERSAHRRLVVRKNSRSGIPGVARYDATARRGAIWMAYWDEADGSRRSATFAVSVHGERDARTRAIEARRRALMRLGVPEAAGVASKPWETTDKRAPISRRARKIAGE